MEAPGPLAVGLGRARACASLYDYVLKCCIIFMSWFSTKHHETAQTPLRRRRRGRRVVQLASCGAPRSGGWNPKAYCILGRGKAVAILDIDSQINSITRRSQAKCTIIAVPFSRTTNIMQLLRQFSLLWLCLAQHVSNRLTTAPTSNRSLPIL